MDKCKLCSRLRKIFTCCYQHSNGIGGKQLRIRPNPNHSSVSCLFNAGNNILTQSILYLLPDAISLILGVKSMSFVSSFIQTHLWQSFILFLTRGKFRQKNARQWLKVEVTGSSSSLILRKVVAAAKRHTPIHHRAVPHLAKEAWCCQLPGKNPF